MRNLPKHPFQCVSGWKVVPRIRGNLVHHSANDALVCLFCGTSLFFHRGIGQDCFTLHVVGCVRVLIDLAHHVVVNRVYPGFALSFQTALPVRLK